MSNSFIDLGRRVFLKSLGAVGLASTLCADMVQFPSVEASSLVAPSKKVRIGIVGGNFGSRFQWHLQPDCKPTAYCDIRQDRLEQLVKTYGPGATYKNFSEFLKHPELDAVAVFTPAPLHVSMATEAMKAGKHVISAVPAGMSIEELEVLLETVKATGMNYMMAETSYYRPEIITCRDWSNRGKFGTVFYAESEYHHEGLLSIMFDEQGLPNWRHGLPPMLYPTHCLGMIVPVMGERMAEVMAIGWGDDHDVLRTNAYKNPFWNTTAFFKTSGGHSSRVSVCWHISAEGTERGSFYGDRISYIMKRPEGSPSTAFKIDKASNITAATSRYPIGNIITEPINEPKHWESLPPSMRVDTDHGGSHTFLTHEFIRSIVEERWPAVNVYEALAYTAPGIIAHQSALRQGESMKIKDYGRAK